jgi:hypothetical protein
MIGDRELCNAATELTRIMGRKNPGASSMIPRRSIRKTGQFLYPRLGAPPHNPKEHLDEVPASF